jgi:hypothetical protein
MDQHGATFIVETRDVKPATARRTAEESPLADLKNSRKLSFRP